MAFVHHQADRHTSRRATAVIDWEKPNTGKSMNVPIKRYGMQEVEYRARQPCKKIIDHKDYQRASAITGDQQSPCCLRVKARLVV